MSDIKFDIMRKSAIEAGLATKDSELDEAMRVYIAQHERGEITSEQLSGIRKNISNTLKNKRAEEKIDEEKRKRLDTPKKEEEKSTKKVVLGEGDNANDVLINADAEKKGGDDVTREQLDDSNIDHNKLYTNNNPLYNSFRHDATFDGGSNFWDMEEEDAVKILREKYGHTDIKFEETNTTTQRRGKAQAKGQTTSRRSFDAIKMIAPDGSEEIIELDLKGFFQEDFGGWEATKIDNYNKLTNFLEAHTAEGDKAQTITNDKERAIYLEKVRTEKLEPTEEEYTAQIEEKELTSTDIFNEKKDTKQVGGAVVEVNLEFGGYEKEIGEARKQLIQENRSKAAASNTPYVDPTIDEIKDKALLNLQNAERKFVRKQKYDAYINELEDFEDWDAEWVLERAEEEGLEKHEIHIPKGKPFRNKIIKEMKSQYYKLKVAGNDEEANAVLKYRANELLLKNSVSKIEASDVYKRFNKTNANIQNLKHNYPSSDNDIQLENGKVMPMHVWEQHVKDQAEVQEMMGGFDGIMKQADESISVLEDNSFKWDMIKRNYNDWERTQEVLGYGFGNLGMTAVYGVPKLLTFGASGGDDEIIRWKEMVAKNRQSFRKDVEWDRAFEDGNFGRFMAQSAVDQIPIYATLATGNLGLGILGSSVFGDKWAEMTMEDRYKDGAPSPTWEKWFKSLGYAASEIVLDYAITVPIMRNARNMMRVGKGKAMLDNGMRAFFKENASKALVFSPALEGISEGATQLTQNAIDGKPLFENIDHAAFLGLTMGVGMSYTGFTSGLITSQFSDHKSLQEVRDNMTEMQKLYDINADITEGLKHLGPRSADGAKGRETIKNNEARIEELINQNEAVINKVNDNIKDKIDPVAYNLFLQNELRAEQIKVEAQKILDSGLDKKTQDKRLKELLVYFDASYEAAKQFKDPKTFGSKWAFVINATSKEGKENLERLKFLAKNELQNEGKQDPDDKKVVERARFIWAKEQVRISNGKYKGNKFARNYKSYETKEEAAAIIEDTIDKEIEVIENAEGVSKPDKAKIIKSLKADKKQTLAGIKDGSLYGLNRVPYNGMAGVKGKVSDAISISIVENQARAERFETRTHEGGHQVFWNALQATGGNQIFTPMAEQILDWTKKNDKGMHKRIMLRTGGNRQGAAEVISVFLEEVGDGKFDVKKNKGFTNLWGLMSNDALTTTTGKDFNFNFAGETDVMNFLVTLGKKIKNGTLNRKDEAAIRKAFKAKADKKAKSQFSQVYQEVETFKEALSSKDPKTKRDAALMIAYTLENEVDRRLPVLEGINQEDKADIVNNFLFDEKRGLMGLLKGYDPKINDSVMGYLNSFVPRTKLKLLDARLMEFYKDDPRFGNIIQSMQQEGVTERVEKQGSEITVKTPKRERAITQDKVVLETFGETALQNEIRTDVVALGVEGVNTYLDVKKNTVSHRKFVGIKNAKGEVVKQIEITPEYKAKQKKLEVDAVKKYKKQGLTEKEAKKRAKKDHGIVELKSLRIPTGKYYPILEKVAKMYGVDPLRLIREQDLTTTMRKSSQDYILSKRDEHIVSLPEGTTRAGNPTGIANTTLGKAFFKAGGRMAFKTTGTGKGLKEQAKQRIDPAAYLAIFGLIPRNRINNTSVDPAIRSQIIQTAALAINQAVRQEKDALKLTSKAINVLSDGKSLTMFSEGIVAFKIDGTINNVLKTHEKLIGRDSIYELNTKDDVDDYVKAVKRDLLPLMPRDFWFGKADKKGNYGTEFTPSSRVVGKKNRKEVYAYYQAEIKKLKNLPDDAFGEDVLNSEGVAFDFSKSSYGSIFKNAEAIKDNIENGKIEEFNDKVSTIHRELWSRIYTSIQNNASTAVAIGNYLKLTGNASNHWHKLGAQFDGYSPNPKGKWKEYKDKKTGKKVKKWTAYEYEHAMPATAAYLYLIDGALKGYNFETVYNPVIDNYKLIALDSAENLKLNTAKLGTKMPQGWNTLENLWWERYFNEIVAAIDGGINPNDILSLNGETFAQRFNINAEGKPRAVKIGINKNKRLDKAITKARTTSYSKTPKGITVLDFDDTLATSKSLVISTSPDGVVRKLTAEEFAQEGADLLDQGWKHDFSEFSKVVDGKVASLFKKAMKLQSKFGPENMFVLTARPADSADAIHVFLTANGLNIPLKNITGLANSTAEAKALWIADKVAEGYNDFYFADDALQNVQAVQNMLDQFDVKSKVQQARVDFVHGDPQVVRLIEESSKNNVKDVDGLTKPGTYGKIMFSKAHRGEYENTIAKNRPDLVKEGLVSKTVDNMFDYIDNLDVPADKKRKYERITTKWLATSNVKLGEDSYKIQQAVELAEKHKEDIFSYRNPNEIIEKYAGKTKTKPTNPKNVKEFGEGRVFNKKHGITVHEVEDTVEGQKAVRKVIDTHWGKDSNPWCITQVKDGKLTDDAWHNWTRYDESKKYIVFQNGKLSSFYANDQYWDRMDSPTDAPVIQIKEGRVTKKVELVPAGGGKVQEFVMETRTVSQDKKTVTTEYHVTKNLGEDTIIAGDYKVEDRVNGITVKDTEYRANGTKYSETNFDKGGKAINNVYFLEDGTVTAINDYGAPFGEMSVNDIIINKGDLLSIGYMDGSTSFYHGQVKMNNQVTGKPQTTEIGWKMPKNLDLRNFVTTSPNGEVRADFKKILEVDPDAKGIPSKKGYTPVTIMFSKGMNMEFNDILEGSTGVESIKEFSDAQARLRGQKTKYKSIIPASAQDFQGLLYNFLGKGEKGEADMAFFKKALIDPFARGINELNASRQSAANDFENLNKNFPEIKKKLNKSIEGLDYTNDQAMRVYLWNKAGFEVPGLSKRDLAALTSFIENNPEMKAYADAIGLISKKEDGYSKPKDYWLAENIASDLLSDGAIGDKRSDFLAEWKQNKDMIFSPENLNKIEAIYGSKFREALEDMLYRMETGRNRPTGNSRLVNGYMNWVNNSVGAIMFLNLRSATLQTISMTNYINWSDNNPLKAGVAFANQKQFWSDFSMIWNSPYLKQRRAGNQRGINEAELSAAVANSDNKAKAAIAWLLKKGFTPTQIADSFAISMGGATMLRNRIKKYVKEGMSQKDAEAKAWLDFQETTEVNQQSARPDMISQQQASPLGRLILAFQNTPMQYTRIMNKATRDLANGRGDYKTHISKIVYYGFVQSVIFGALQSALYASLGDDDEEDFDKKKERILNQMVDSWLTGIGVGGKAIGTVKNTLMEYFKQRDKGFNSDHAYTLLTLLSFSPPIGSKLRKIYSSIQTEQFNRGVFSKRGFTLDNPIWSGVGNVIEGVTNAPFGRMANLMLQLDNAMDSSHQWWERVALTLGQNTWDLGIKDPDIEAAKADVKKDKKNKKKTTKDINKEAVNKKKQAQERKEGKTVVCAAVSKSGNRCKTKVEPGSSYCTVHIKVKQNKDGKKSQCRKIKKGGKRCKMQTSASSGYCYYHD
jgi:hypothetical protein